MDWEDHAAARGDARVRRGRGPDEAPERGRGGPDPRRAPIHPRSNQRRVEDPDRPRAHRLLLRDRARRDDPARHAQSGRDVRQVRRSDRRLRRQPRAARGACAPGCARLPAESHGDAEGPAGRDPANLREPGSGACARTRTRRHGAAHDRASRSPDVRLGEPRGHWSGPMTSSATTEATARLVSTSMAAYLAGHPDLRYTFFGGKGGVGKTVMAGVSAVHLARSGRRTLLASTNPVHSLSGLLDQDVFGRQTAVEGFDNLWAYEIDTKDAIDRSKKDIRQKIQWFLKFAEIKTKADEFVEAATMNPAFEESAMFENMVDLMFKNEYDVYVFDTAPTANARRLLGMSKVYGLWVQKMLKSREEAQSLREVLSFTKKKEGDPLMDYLVSFRERIRHARELLTDPARTAFFFVTMLIRPDEGEAAPDFVRNRIESQAGYLDEIGQRFPGQVRAVVPLYDSDIRGIPSLDRATGDVFS